MAENMAESVAVDTPDINWGAVGGWLVAAATVVVTWLTSRKKADIDESALILGKYKELADTFANQVKVLQNQFNDFKIATAEEKRTMQSEIDGLRGRVRQLEEENSGLKAAIRQNSQSAAVLLQRKDAEIEEAAEKLKRVGDNIIRGMDK